jgi:hypothetical protein
MFTVVRRHVDQLGCFADRPEGRFHSVIGRPDEGHDRSVGVGSRIHVEKLHSWNGLDLVRDLLDLPEIAAFAKIGDALHELLHRCLLACGSFLSTARSTAGRRESAECSIGGAGTGDQPNDLPDDLPNDLSGDLPNDLSGDLPNDLPGDLPNDLPGDLPDDLPNDPVRGARRRYCPSRAQAMRVAFSSSESLASAWASR